MTPDELDDLAHVEEVRDILARFPEPLAYVDTPPPRFVTWLRRQGHRPDPIGDLAQDIELDIERRCLTAWGFKGIRRHIRQQHTADQAVFDALDAAHELWLSLKRGAA